MGNTIKTVHDIGKESIVPVNILPSIVIGIIGFFILMYVLIAHIEPYITEMDKAKKYNSDGCEVDIDGNPIRTPIYSKGGQITGYNECLRKSSPMLIYIFGTIFAIILSTAISSIIYRIQVSIYNPKAAAGIAMAGWTAQAVGLKN